MDDLIIPQAPIIDDDKDTNLKKPSLSRDEIAKWLSRAKVASKYHHREIFPKYRQAKRRYNSEIGYGGVSSVSNTARINANHNDINLLFKDIRDFIGSIFYRNPTVNLSARTENDQEIKNIQVLEQAVNDDIADRKSELKALFRSALLDESLAGLGAIYIDYDYRHREMTDQAGNVIGAQWISNKVAIIKIKPENLIRPKLINFYNYKDAEYLGYVDIPSIEQLKNDPTLDQAVVAKLRGKTYKNLLDVDVRELDKKMTEEDDGILHAKIFTLFIKGNDGLPIKRLVLADDENVSGSFLAYDDYDKGHGKDDRGYPIHVLQLNDGSDSFLPPSEAWLLEPLLTIIDHIFQKMNRHIRRASTKTMIKVGQGGADKTLVDKWIRNNDLEVLPIENLPPGIDVRTLLNQITDQPLSQDHQIMFERTMQLYENLSRQPSFSMPSVLNRKKTATEAEAIQQTDSTENADYIDKFGDFLKDVFYDWAKLLQKNMQGIRELSIENEQTGENEQVTATKDNFQGRFICDINVQSFLPPNKALKRQQVLQTTTTLTTILGPLVKQMGFQLNSKKLIDMFLENVDDIRDSDDLLIPIPQRNIDQQVLDLVFHNQPMNPDELGEDLEKSLDRLREIFGDGQMMADFEKFHPGIGSSQDSPIIQFMLGLNQMLQAQQGGTKKTPPRLQSVPAAPSDMRSNAGLMASVQ